MRIAPRKEAFAMKRALVLLLAGAALVAGCGSSGSGSGSGGSSSGGSSVSTATAASVLQAASAATKDATSAGFDAKLGVKIGGHLAGAGAAGALLQGPVTLEFKGHAGKAANGKGAKFDVDFAVNYTGGSLSGEALSPDGKTLYVKMPLLMGPGWHSLPLSGLSSSGSGSSSGSSASSGLDALKAEGADPSQWLKNLRLSTSGGQDTISADVDFPKLFADISKVSQSGMTAKDRLQMAQVEHALKVAHGSLSFDSSTHLPTDENIKLAMAIPPSLQTQASGVKTLALNLDIKFSDWNQDFTVKAPAGATPFTWAALAAVGA
jgi:hypothetical protein